MVKTNVVGRSNKKMKKFAFIMRGVPGSGKSITPQYFVRDGGRVHAVDNFHTNENGYFWWDETQVKERYQQNFEAFVQSCQEGVSTVVCDNINVTRDDYQKYVECAVDHGYITSIVTLNNPVSLEAANRNKHSVTIEQIEDMYDRWED